MDFISDLLSNTIGQTLAVGIVAILSALGVRKKWFRNQSPDEWKTRVIDDGNDLLIECVVELWKKAGILESELQNSEELAQAIFETNRPSPNNEIEFREMIWVTEPSAPDLKNPCAAALGATYGTESGFFFVSALGVDPDKRQARPNPLDNLYKAIASSFRNPPFSLFRGLIFEIEDWRRMDSNNQTSIKVAQERERSFARTFLRRNMPVRVLDLPYIQPAMRPSQIDDEVCIPLLLCVHLASWGPTHTPSNIPLEQAADILDFLFDAGYLGISRCLHRQNETEFLRLQNHTNQLKNNLLPTWYGCSPDLRKYLGETVALKLLEGTPEHESNRNQNF
ncbi:MAG: hypothetical protein JKY96_04005 [Phycisphaerales bacterium]|nr:hypothetical protein [Phycisphaerales bacterium]